jgi:SAM-dependent methyltransferase
MEPVTEISPDDRMFKGNLSRYLAVGKSAVAIVNTALSLGGLGQPRTVLDYGAGSGRVTRWLPVSFPDAEIHACDVSERSVAFVRQSIGVTAFTVPMDPNELRLPTRYDVIWVGSVVTHLPEQTTRALLKALARSSNLLVVTFHGRHHFKRQETGARSYIHEDGWNAIQKGYLSTGYGYADHETGGGISMCTPEWMVRHAPGRIVLLSERGWGRQDVMASLQLAL